MQNVILLRILFLLFVLVFMVGVIVLQVFLSKKESKWLGLILPIITFMFSIFALLGVLLFSVHTVGYSVSTVIVNGEIVERIVDHQAATQVNQTGAIIASAIYLFLLSNIPTAILLFIYKGCRGKIKQQRDLEKMSVQDLE